MSAVNGVIAVWCNGVISIVYTIQSMSAVNGVITVWCNGVISNVYIVCQQLTNGVVTVWLYTLYVSS